MSLYAFLFFVGYISCHPPSSTDSRRADVIFLVILPLPLIQGEQTSVNEPHHKKTKVLVSDLVRHKQGCTATEDGKRLEISDLEIRGIVLSKLTRNKNARHIFPHHFFPVAMIGIICLHMHFVLYTMNTRSIFFKYLHYFR